jgi:N-acetyl-anhydromuramyl-L-alanine amidase AmpD
MDILIPTAPNHRNEAGQFIYMITPKADHFHKRPVAGDIDLLVIHDTDGTDSREYLGNNDRLVSTTYLVGSYQDTGGLPRIYKYMSEANDAPHAQGFGSLGGQSYSTGQGINDVCISFEIECLTKTARGVSFNPAVLEEASLLVGAVLAYWRKRGRDPLIIDHKRIDKRKRDVRFHWNDFLGRVYHHYERLKAV